MLVDIDSSRGAGGGLGDADHRLAERQANREPHADEAGVIGRHLVVGNGYAPSGEYMTEAAMVTVKAPR